MAKNKRESGSSIIMAVFVLVLVSAMGVALLFLSDREIESSQADVRGKQTFYFSEAGLENGRTDIYDMNKNSVDPILLTEELTALAGLNGQFDFDLAALAPTFDANGRLTGFSAGVGDDTALTGLTNFGSGRYMTFITNDPADGVTSPVDTNSMALITAVGTSRDNALEVTQALVRRVDAFASLPATITILGDHAIFQGGNSSAKSYTGDEGSAGTCPGANPGVHKPVVGTIGAVSEASAELGLLKPGTYTSDGQTGAATVVDLTTDPNLPSIFTDCQELLDLARNIKFEADVIGTAATPVSDLGVPGAPKIVFIEDDYDFGGNFDGGGLLFVTGQLTMDGATGWVGPIFVVGKGDFLRDGAGNGDISGGVLVADIAGADRVLFTADDCAGPDGIHGNGNDGVEPGTYIVNGAGASTTGYCSTVFPPFQGLKPFDIVSFRQQ